MTLHFFIVGFGGKTQIYVPILSSRFCDLIDSLSTSVSHLYNQGCNVGLSNRKVLQGEKQVKRLVLGVKITVVIETEPGRKQVLQPEHCDCHYSYRCHLLSILATSDLQENNIDVTSTYCKVVCLRFHHVFFFRPSGAVQRMFHNRLACGRRMLCFG